MPIEANSPALLELIDEAAPVEQLCTGFQFVEGPIWSPKEQSAVAELQKEGKVRCIGFSNSKPAHMGRIQPIAPITSLQPPYSILSPEIEPEILPYCARHNIGVIVYSPMKSGLLTGAMTRDRIAQMPQDDFRQRTISFKEPLLTRNLNLVELMREIGNHHGRTPDEVALAWTLRRPEVTGVIVGLRSPRQVDGIIGAADFRLSNARWKRSPNFSARTPRTKSIAAVNWQP